jgi:hypothetical protein
VCLRDDIRIQSEEDILDWSSEELKQRVERMVLEYSSVDDAGDEAEARFVTSPMIQALISLADPVAHSSTRAREEAKGNKWNFAQAYYVYAENFEGNNVRFLTKGMEEILKNEPRSFDAKVFDDPQVRKLNV